MDFSAVDPVYAAFTAVLGMWSLCNMFGDHSKTPIDTSTIPQPVTSATKAGRSGSFNLGEEISRQLESIMSALAAMHTALTSTIGKIDSQLDNLQQSIVDLKQLYVRSSSSTFLLLFVVLFLLLAFILGSFMAYRAIMREVAGIKAKIDSTIPMPLPSSDGSAPDQLPDPEPAPALEPAPEPTPELISSSTTQEHPAEAPPP